MRVFSNPSLFQHVWFVFPGFGGEPSNFFMVSSAYCCVMILLNTLWGVVAFDAYDKKNWKNVAYVWATHLLVSCLVRLTKDWCNHTF